MKNKKIREDAGGITYFFSTLAFALEKMHGQIRQENWFFTPITQYASRALRLPTLYKEVFL